MISTNNIDKKKHKLKDVTDKAVNSRNSIPYGPQPQPEIPEAKLVATSKKTKSERVSDAGTKK